MWIITGKNSTFWKWILCSPTEVRRRFTSKYSSHFRDEKVRQIGNRKKKSANKTALAAFLFFNVHFVTLLWILIVLNWFILRPWRWRQYVYAKRLWTTGIRCVTFQKMVLFTVIGARTWKPMLLGRLDRAMRVLRVSMWRYCQEPR
jgi:hypothetical protein